LLLQIGRRLPPDTRISNEQLAPVMREQVAAATDRHFTPERRAVLAQRMKDSALSVIARLGEHAGLQIAAVIHVFQGAGLITNPPSDVKFLTGYFDKALALLAAQQGGQLRIPIPRPPSTAATDTASASEAQGGTEAAPSGESAEATISVEAPATSAAPEGAGEANPAPAEHT
jgi:hypothetical protein